MDGTKDGYEITLTKAVSKAVSVPVIASGGCGTLQHMADVLQNSGADAALAASIDFIMIHMVYVREQFLKDQGISVRPCEKCYNVQLSVYAWKKKSEKLILQRAAA